MDHFVYQDVGFLIFSLPADYTKISCFQALSVSRQIGAAAYIETSAKNSPKSTHDVFEVAALAAFGKLNKKYVELQRQNCTNLPANGKPKINLKSELKGRAKRCSLM